MLSFNSYGEWTKVTEDVDGDSYYIDFQTVNKKSNGYVVWWEMKSSAKGWDGTMSSKSYNKGDCEEFKTTFLAIISYTKPMGGGESEQFGGGVIELETILGWNYPPPDSVAISNLRTVCSLADQSSMNNYQSKVLELIAEFESYDWRENTLSSLELVDASLTDQQQVLQSAWVSNISAKIKSVWRFQGAEDDWWCNVYISQKRNGEVKAVTIGRCHNMGDTSKAQAFKNSLERAVYKSSPLPSAPDDSVFEEEIMFTFFVN